MYMVAIFSLAIFNNYLALYVKRLSATNAAFVFAGLVLLFSLAALEYYKVFSIAEFSNKVFSLVATRPLTGLLFPAAALAIFLVNAN